MTPPSPLLVSTRHNFSVWWNTSDRRLCAAAMFGESWKRRASGEDRVSCANRSDVCHLLEHALTHVSKTSLRVKLVHGDHSVPKQTNWAFPDTYFVKNNHVWTVFVKEVKLYLLYTVFCLLFLNIWPHSAISFCICAQASIKIFRSCNILRQQNWWKYKTVKLMPSQVLCNLKLFFF